MVTTIHECVPKDSDRMEAEHVPEADRALHRPAPGRQTRRDDRPFNLRAFASMLLAGCLVLLVASGIALSMSRRGAGTPTGMTGRCGEQANRNGWRSTST